MALNIGSRIGPYEIQSALGAGGMGEIYRARDAMRKLCAGRFRLMKPPNRKQTAEALGAAHGGTFSYAHPSCFRLMVSFQIFVMWRILSPSNCITYT